MEASSPTSTAILLLRYFLIISDKSVSLLLQISKLLKHLRNLFLSSIRFFLRLLRPNKFNPDYSNQNYYYDNHTHGVNFVPPVDGGINAGVDSGIGRALSQLLTIVNNIPVSSRKYEVVRSLADRLIDENLLETNETLRLVNISVLSAAFARTLSQLEAVMVVDVDQCRRSHHGHGGVGDVINSEGSIRDCVRSLSCRLVRYCGGVLTVWQKWKLRDEMWPSSGRSAEKLAAELLWLAQKMEACGASDDVVHKWSSASELASLSLTAEPRLQRSLVKISAFLIKQARALGKERREESTKGQARVLGKERSEEESTKEQTKVKIIKVGDTDTVNILLLWIPLLCQASMGIDTPVLAVSDRIELEKILGDIIEALEQEENQEKVLALWLHHFIYCPSSDWPNLHGCYTHWCTQSRRSLLMRTK